MFRRLLSVLSLAALAPLWMAPAQATEAGSVYSNEHYDDPYSFVDHHCGFRGRSSATQRAPGHLQRPRLHHEAFLEHDHYRFHETWRNPDTGKKAYAHGHGYFRNSARSTSGATCGASRPPTREYPSPSRTPGTSRCCPTRGGSRSRRSSTPSATTIRCLGRSRSSTRSPSWATSRPTSATTTARSPGACCSDRLGVSGPLGCRTRTRRAACAPRPARRRAGAGWRRTAAASRPRRSPGGRAGDEGAAAALGHDDAVGLERAVDPGDGVDGEAELGGQRPHGGQPGAGGRSPEAARVAIWRAQLLVRRVARGRVERVEPMTRTCGA